MTVTYTVGDTREAIKGIADGSVDLIASSPPFLALRSYVPADHESKGNEIGSERNPAEFIDMLLGLTAEWGRVLAPHGSIAIELGDTYSGSSQVEGRGKFWNGYGGGWDADNATAPGRLTGAAAGWPRAKSLALIPQLYAVALAYGINPLTGQASPAGRWLVRNVIVWHRCLDIDATVYVRTPTGDRPMRLLHLHQQYAPGKFQLWNGEKWTNVVGTSSRTTDDAIELTFRNGERISCTRDHRWPIVDKQEARRADELTVGDVVPWTRLPAREGARTPTGLPDDIGWLAGLFLADGSFDSRGRIQFACHSKDASTTGARLAAIAEQYDGTCSWYNQEGNSATCVVRSDVLAAIIRRYIAGDNARNKHLSINAWNRTDAFLDAVLHGYLAGDGHWDETNQRWRIVFTDNIWLARDLRAVAARLGIELYLRRVRRPDQVGHHVQGLPFMHRGHLRFATPGDTRYQPGQIRTITESKRASFIDVAVEDEPHTFALSSGLLTHNSNPAVGALGDKVRPSTSYIVVATRSAKRWFDLTAVRTEPSRPRLGTTMHKVRDDADPHALRGSLTGAMELNNPAGAPPLDAWFDPYDGTHDTWTLTTQPSRLAHYAMWPAKLAERLILSMCPREVCRVCRQPRRRIEGAAEYLQSPMAHGSGRAFADTAARGWSSGIASGRNHSADLRDGGVVRTAPTLGWTDCGCVCSTCGGTGQCTYPSIETQGLVAMPCPDCGGRCYSCRNGGCPVCLHHYRPGLVLDPFAGSGTTLAVADLHGRDAIGVDFDARNKAIYPARYDEVSRALFGTKPELPGQGDLFAEVAG